jgi:tetratricopeptide (TPR) repeat protein
MAETVFKIGDLIENRYKVLAVINTGGMGTLYRVSDDVQNGEIIALKIVRMDVPAIDISERLTNFKHEFQILAQMRHPNLVSVFDYGVTVAGELYFTMEYVEGRDLEPRGNPRDPVGTIPIIVQVCRALAYLHSRGLVHGDLKPANVLMVKNQIKIVDFGVAREILSSEASVQYYTPGYSAPEVRQRGRINYRADLYSLGAIWYALLTGEPPWFAPEARKSIPFFLKEILGKQVQVPVEICAVITCLLAESPDKRYSEANEVIEAINRIMGSCYEIETRETAGSYALRSRFVGREAEMAMLQATWEQAKSAEGKLVLVSGELGVGKTRLVEEFAQQEALEGSRIIRGHCLQSGAAAFRPWREVLRVLVRYIELTEKEFMKRPGPVLAALLPELEEREYMRGLAQPVELDAKSAQQRLNEAIVQVLRKAAELRPTLVIIEDSHWADEASLTLINLLARISGQAGLLVCVIYRHDELAADHPLLLLSAERVQRIALQGLSSETIIAMVQAMLGLEQLPLSLTERVRRITGGNAFFVQELIRSLAEEGVVLRRTVQGWQFNQTALQEAHLPDTILQVLAQRLDHLSAETQHVLGRASMAGSLFWDGLVEAIAQVSADRVQAALKEGLDQEMILAREQSSLEAQKEFIFVKPAIQEVCYESALIKDRQKIHERIAVWLMSRPEKEIREHLGLIADHLEKAGRREQAVDYFRQAGEQAAARFANAEAVMYLSRALDLTTAADHAMRYRLLLSREKVHDLQGAREAQALDLAALQELPMLPSDKFLSNLRQAEVALRQSHYNEVIGNYPAAIAAAETAIRSAKAYDNALIEAVGHVQWGMSLWQQGYPKAALPKFEQALVIAQTHSIRDVEADSLRNLGIVCIYLGDYPGAKKYYERSLDLYREMGNREREARTLNNLAVVATHVGFYAEARTCFEQALRTSREIGDRRNESIELQGLCLLMHYMGEEEAALEYGRQSLNITREVGDRRSEGYALIWQGHALSGLGRWAEAAEAYRQVLSLRRELGQHQLVVEPLAGLANISLSQGNQVQAKDHIEEILNFLESHTLEGTEEPLQAYWICYRVLQAVRDHRAPRILDTAHQLLQEQVAHISDEEMQRSFLENVAAHREIVKEFQARFGNPAF